MHGFCCWASVQLSLLSDSNSCCISTELCITVGESENGFVISQPDHSLNTPFSTQQSIKLLPTPSSVLPRCWNRSGKSPRWRAVKKFRRGARHHPTPPSFLVHGERWRILPDHRTPLLARKTLTSQCRLYRLESVGAWVSSPEGGRRATVKFSGQHDGQPSSDLTRCPCSLLADT